MSSINTSLDKDDSIGFAYENLQKLNDVVNHVEDVDNSVSNLWEKMDESESILITLNTSVDNIESDVSDLNRKKIVFNARLTDGINEYIPRGDYTSSPFNFTGRTIKMKQHI